MTNFRPWLCSRDLLLIRSTFQNFNKKMRKSIAQRVQGTFVVNGWVLEEKAPSRLRQLQPEKVIRTDGHLQTPAQLATFLESRRLREPSAVLSPKGTHKETTHNRQVYRNCSPERVPCVISADKSASQTWQWQALHTREHPVMEYCENPRSLGEEERQPCPWGAHCGHTGVGWCYMVSYCVAFQGVSAMPSRSFSIGFKTVQGGAQV